MLSEKMCDAINTQINKEMYSAYLYLSMSAYFSSIDLNGMANWMRVQYDEEMFHAMKLYNFVIMQGGRIKLQAIEEPDHEFKSAEDVFKKTLKHEKKVTGLINDLVDLAISEKDHATNIFLQWFVTEQVEEEATASEILQKVKMLNQSPHGLFMLDRELGQRTFTPPAQQE